MRYNFPLGVCMGVILCACAVLATIGIVEEHDKHNPAFTEPPCTVVLPHKHHS